MKQQHLPRWTASQWLAMAVACLMGMALGLHLLPGRHADFWLIQPVVAGLLLLLALMLLAVPCLFALDIRVSLGEEALPARGRLLVVASNFVMHIAKTPVSPLAKYGYRLLTLCGLLWLLLVELQVLLGQSVVPVLPGVGRLDWPSPQTIIALCLLLTCTLLSTYQRKITVLMMQILGLIVVAFGLSALIGQLLNGSIWFPLLLADRSSSHASVLATLAMVMLGLAFVLLNSRDVFLALPVRIFSSVRIVVMLVVSLIAIPILLGWFISAIQLGETHGPDAALSLLVVANILLLMPVIMEVARRLLRKELQIRAAMHSLEQALQEKEALAQELQELSNRDALTGLYNRRYFEYELSRCWRRASRTQQPLSLLFIDVDHFKNYNDAYGHQLGDQCLRRIATLISESVSRDSDVVARYGGEEFVVVLPDTPRAGAIMLAERMGAQVREALIPHINSPVAEVVTLSIGVATVAAQHHLNVELLVQRADQALYEAKSGGRNRVFVAPDAP